MSIHKGARAGRNAAILAILMAGTAIGPISVMPARAQSVIATSLDIPAQPLADALIAFSRQTKVQIFAPSSLASGKTSSPVKGNLAPDTALRQLLSGTGLSFAFANAKSATIVAPGTAGGGVPQAAGSVLLDTITVTGKGGIGADFDPDAAYTTPGPVVNVDRAVLDRVPPASIGDIMKGLPGVTVGDNRNGGGFQPNIRGAQGMGRVKVVVDGAEASTSVYRGYGGNSETNYVDPDFLAGYSVEKGPVAEGGGAIGGMVRMRTMEAKDIIKSGRTWGLRTTAMLGNNAGDSAEARGKCYGWCSSPTMAPNFTVGSSQLAGISDKNYSGSAVGAWRPNDMFEFVGGVSRRQNGNYSAGSNGTKSAKNDSFYGPGEEVFGTYSNTKSVMLKGAFIPTDEHRLTFGFNRFQNRYAARKTASLSDTTGIDQYYPRPSNVDRRTYTAGYAWTPENNPWINLKADLWHVKTAEDRAMPINQRVITHTNGIRLSNRSEIDLSWFVADLDIGGQYRHERVRGSKIDMTTAGYDGQNDVGNGAQDLYGIYTSLQLPVTDWLTLHGGVRQDWYETNRVGTTTVSNHSRVNHSSGNGATFNGGIIVKPFEGVQVFGKYSQGWRAPTMREELLDNDNIAGAAIRPEQSENFEIGFNYARSGLLGTNDSLGVKVSYFDNRYTDYIVGNGYWPGFFNAPRARFQGIETSLRYDIGWAYAEYGFTHYVRRRFCGMTFLGPQTGAQTCTNVEPAMDWELISGNIPPHNKHDLTLGFRMFDEKLDVGATMTRVDGVRKPNSSTIKLGNATYTVFDAFLRYNFENDLKLNLSVANLADKYYFESGTQNNIALPAPGRTVKLTLSKAF